MRPKTRLTPDESRAYYDDVRDHLLRVIDMIDTMRDYLAGSLDIYTTQQTQRINQSMQRPPAISLIFLPLTFVTGIYGMNFVFMRETHLRFGFYSVLTLCVLVGGGMLYYLRRKTMLRRSRALHRLRQRLYLNRGRDRQDKEPQQGRRNTPEIA
jgi:magnesium transporter